jgi:hypothetical protein
MGREGAVKAVAVDAAKTVSAWRSRIGGSLSDFLCVEVMRRYRKKRPYDRNNKHDQEEQEIERAEAVSG